MVQQTTPDLGIPELAQAQAFPEVTHNEAIVLLQLLQKGVIDRGLNPPPGAPTEGDSYILGAAPTGAWAGRANALAIFWGGVWRFLPGRDDLGAIIAMGARQEGLSVWVNDENTRYTWSGSAWTNTGGPFVLLAGDTMTGPLIVNAGAATAVKAAQTTSGLTNTDAALVVESSDPGASGPTFAAWHNSVSPVVNDAVYRWRSYANDSLGAPFVAAQELVLVTNVTAGAMAAEHIWATAAAGTFAFRARLALGLFMDLATGGDQGIGTINATSLYANANIIADTNGLLRARVLTVGTLPAAVQGAKAHVTDALAPAFGAAVVGGGAVSVPVYGNNAPAWFVG